MNIGIDARYLENEMTGIGRYSYNLLLNILQVDHENHYHVFLRNTYTGEVPRSPNTTYYYLSYPPISLRTLFPISSHAIMRTFDLFHSHFPVAPLLSSTPSVVTVHDLQPLLVPRLGARRSWPLRIAYHIYYPLFYRTTLMRAKAIIAVSNATRWYLENCLGIAREKIHVIHLAIDDRFRTQETSENANALGSRSHIPGAFLLYVGATLPHKNVANLLKGYARAVSSGNLEGISLILAGRTSRFDVELQRLIEELGIQNVVQRIGYVPQEELHDLYAMAEALLYVTRYEGFGFPPLEAIHYGVPVIAACHASLPEVVGPCGVFVDPDDIEGIARAILSVVHNTELRGRLASMGKNRLSRFSWRKAAIETIRIYEQVYTQ